MIPLMKTDHFGLADRITRTVGKVREIYDLGDRLLIITTDRISAFDVVLRQAIVGKGHVLTAMTVEWLKLFKSLLSELSAPEAPFDHHLISTDVNDLPKEFVPFADELDGRFMIVRKCIPIPIECIVRGYISGSFWKEYREACNAQPDGDFVVVHGFKLPRGMKESEIFDEPIFTPSTKADDGEHDRNIDRAEMIEILRDWLQRQGRDASKAEELADRLAEAAVKIYTAGREHAAKNGIIIADTKFEFGLSFDPDDWTIYLIDEVLTPDSSRFWPADQYVPGQAQLSFDKQYVRDYLLGISWDKQPPIPDLPDEVVGNTSEKYCLAANLLFGLTIETDQK